MKRKCYYCSEIKECRRIKGDNNELEVGYMALKPPKFRDVCKECEKKQGGIVGVKKDVRYGN